MNAEHAEWITQTYDDIVAEAGEDGMSVKEIREQVAQRYEEAIRTGELSRGDIDLYSEGLGLFDRIVRPTRDSRKSKMQREMETIVAVCNNETILGQEDPMLDMAFPLGDGRDKILRLWNGDDLQSAAMTRYRKAAEATASAAIFDELASMIRQNLAARGVRNIGGLFGSSGGFESGAA